MKVGRLVCSEQDNKKTVQIEDKIQMKIFSIRFMPIVALDSDVIKGANVPLLI